MSEVDVRPVLSARGATFAYDGRTALSDVDIDVAPGEALALIGPNGSGKSTFLRGILGLLPLSGGSLDVDRSAVGYLPQSDTIDPEFPISLEQIVMLGRYPALPWWRWPSRADREAVRSALETVGLAHRATERFGSLSGGQRQRGILARALAAGPNLLLLDEPFNGLDQANRESLVSTLQELRRRGVAIIVSTHDLDLAREVCDSVLLLNGRPVAAGPLDDVLTLQNVQECFAEVGVEIDEHTLVVPGHEGH